MVHVLNTVEEFNQNVSQPKYTLVHFSAAWCSPCTEMDKYLDQLASAIDKNTFQFTSIDAENLSDITEKYNVSSVPTFLFFQNGKVVETVEGADPEKVGQVVSKLTQKQVATLSVRERCEKIVNQSPLVLFMKGSPSAPRCGFSNQIVQILNKHKLQYEHFDVLSDETVRAGIKEYGNWPTFPQLYSKGKLVGGLDIVKELDNDGMLMEELGLE